MKPITKVFIIIGALVMCLVIWSAVFNDGGVIRLAWNGLVVPINNAYDRITGGAGTDALLPEWETRTGNIDINSNELGGAMDQAVQ